MIFSAKGQSKYQFNLIARIDTSVKFLSVDRLDNIYLITQKNELLKYNASGKFLYRYSNKDFGNDFQIDVTDPLRVLIFYPLFQQIIILNNTLSEISRYTFNRDVSKRITLAATANDNGIWVYDQNNQELHKLSNDFIDEYSAGNIYQQTSVKVQPEILITNSQFVYLYDKKTGILQFDRFGSYIKTILVDSLNQFQINNEEIIYLDNNSLKRLNIQTYNLQPEPLPMKNIQQAALGNKILSLSTGNQVYIYSFNSRN